ncbi:hypothetical protein CRG98_039442 [Punica granatum]|uniref:Uncharacterized protein n=1 Tax=Punica granatum TaxID=22663 RepID=A0A2I0I949_PUNGR|nr:hypothetical protein CRG98_039442 [Punica granatum]
MKSIPAVDVVESQWNVLHGRIQDSYDFTELVLFRQEYLLALISESFLDISFVSRILDSRMKLCPQFYWNIENQETSQTHLNWRTLQRTFGPLFLFRWVQRPFKPHFLFHWVQRPLVPHLAICAPLAIPPGPAAICAPLSILPGPAAICAPLAIPPGPTAI